MLLYQLEESRSPGVNIYHLLSLVRLQHASSEVQTLGMYVWGPSIAAW